MSAYPDAVVGAGEFHTIVFEDDRLRILKVTLPAGAKAPMHMHPENVNCIVVGGTVAITSSDGTLKEITLEDGATIHGQFTEHAVENLGKRSVETIQIEFKRTF